MCYVFGETDAFCLLICPAELRARRTPRVPGTSLCCVQLMPSHAQRNLSIRAVGPTRTLSFSLEAAI